MFYIMHLIAEINLHPSLFGSKLKATVRKRVIEEKEGQSVPKYGYVVSVMAINDDDIGAGVVDSTNGFAKFMVRYQALLFRPFKNEVCDAVVESVTQVGFFARLGPFNNVYCTHNRFPPELRLERKDGKPVWTSEDGSWTIEEGSHVRIKIITATLTATQLSAVACIDEDCLGPTD